MISFFGKRGWRGLAARYVVCQELIICFGGGG